MRKVKVKFSTILIGNDFFWSSDTLKKISNGRAKSLTNRQEFIFKSNDTVLIEEEEDDLVNFENTYYDYSWNNTKQTSDRCN